MARKSGLFPNLVDEAEWVMWPASTRLVWITLMAMADKNCEVDAHITAVARRANVPLKETEEAIQIMLQPNPYSRYNEHEGRTLQKTPRGWTLLQLKHYGK